MGVTFFTSGGVKLAVHETGTGLPMVFQHGLCGDAVQPIQVFPESSGFSCVTVECRGHGQSETGAFEGLSVAEFAGDLLGFIHDSGYEKPVIGGISMGAAIALRLAVRNPGMFKGLVLARPAWITAGAPENLYPNASAGKLIAQFPPAEAAATFEKSNMAALLKKEGPDNLSSIRGFFQRKPADVTSQLLQRISADAPGVTEDEIRRISIPTLVIGNTLDYVHPIAYARTLAEWIPSARFVEVASKARNPLQYQSDFKAALAAFLKEL